MKGVFVILDGAADLPCQSLNNKTPLEAANTPNLDSIAKKSKIDYCYPIKEGVSPESSSAIVSLLGYNPSSVSRGPLEARGAAIPLKKGDLAFRCNFATVDNLKEGNIMDARAGRTLTTKEARLLALNVNKKVKLPYKFDFISTSQHRAVLILRGGFSENISNADPFYGAGMTHRVASPKITFSQPLDEEDDSKLSADLVNNFLRLSHEVLDKDQINIRRAKKGLYSANFILCRDPGNEIARFKKMKGKWLALGYMPLEKGIAETAGMDVYKFKYPEMKGMDVYANLYDGLNEAVNHAIKMIKKNKNKYDYFYIHLKETDIPGHDNKPHDKVKMIEFIDKRFFSYLKDVIKDKRLIITADHTTSCALKSHTADPVPVLIYPNDGKEREQRFTEKDAVKGKKIYGQKLLENNLFIRKA